MSQETWSAVDRYIADLFIPADPALEAVLQSSRAADLPEINVSPTQGKLLNLLARMQQARRILEIGTLGGYSTIWLARALPADGRLITLEADPKHAKVAQANIAGAGVESKVQLRLGRAIETLPKLAGEPPFDFIFIDADKTSMAEYLTWAVKLSRPGTVIISDNVIRKGAVTDANSVDENVRGVRKFNEQLAADSRLSATEIQTVGSKGYDGFAIIYVNSVG